MRGVTITLRLTSEETELLDRAAKHQRVSRSEVMRRALKLLGAKVVEEQTLSIHDRWQRYIPQPRPGRRRKVSLSADKGDSWYRYLLKKQREGRL